MSSTPEWSLTIWTAVRGLHQDVVGAVRDRRGVADDRRVRPAEVAGEDDAPRLLSRVARVDLDDRRAEDVPGVAERRRDARRDLDRLVVVERPEVLHRLFRVADVVEGLEEPRVDLRSLLPEALLGIEALLHVVVRRPRAAATAALGTRVRRLLLLLARVLARLAARHPCGSLAPVLRLLLLDLAAVQQHQSRQLHGRARGVDRAAEATLDEQRDEARVVEMRVSEQQDVDRPRVDREAHPVPCGVARRTLEHAAVDHHARPVGR
jgi:hypothetical protein